MLPADLWLRFHEIIVTRGWRFFCDAVYLLRFTCRSMSMNQRSHIDNEKSRDIQLVEH